MNISDHTRSITRAEIGIFNHNFCHVGNIPFGLCLYNGFMKVQLLAKRYGCFSRKADHTQTVRAVGRDFEIHHMVALVKTKI